MISLSLSCLSCLLQPILLHWRKIQNKNRNVIRNFFLKLWKQHTILCKNDYNTTSVQTNITKSLGGTYLPVGLLCLLNLNLVGCFPQFKLTRICLLDEVFLHCRLWDYIHQINPDWTQTTQSSKNKAIGKGVGKCLIYIFLQ